LDVAYGFDVRVSLGRPEAVTVTYDDNLADLLDVGVDGRTLRIQLKPNTNIDHHPTPRAEVTMTRLEELRSAGAATVTVASKLPDSGLRLLVSGSSRVGAELALDRAEATVSGASRLELTGTATPSAPRARAPATSSWPISTFKISTSGFRAPATAGST
jgi:Putative auto-transporter adhesin, head GIN domain